MSALAPSRLSPADVLRTGSLGLRVRRMRAALSALGIAIGVASMVAVLGISESSKADLLAQLDTLGTNLLRVAPGQSFLGEDAVLPESAAPMLRRADGVEEVAATEAISGRTVRRSPYIDENETGGISVVAADPSLLATTGGTLAHGRFLDAATARYPTVVLGADAAATLGIDDAGGRVWITDRWFTVIGILDPVTLADGLDSAALIGFDAAVSLYGVDRTRRRSTCAPIRTGSRTCATSDAAPTRSTRRRSMCPGRPTRWRPGGGQDRVHVALPRARRGGAVGRRRRDRECDGDLGARASLGDRPAARAGSHAAARRRAVPGRVAAAGRLGGVCGSLLGAAVTVGYAKSEGWTATVPAIALAGGVGVAVAVGALAGLYPAMRAARLSPTEALRTT